MVLLYKYNKWSLPFLLISMMQNGLDESNRKLIVWERWSVLADLFDLVLYATFEAVLIN